jgi:hypothetical protein
MGVDENLETWCLQMVLSKLGDLVPTDGAKQQSETWCLQMVLRKLGDLVPTNGAKQTRRLGAY